jgi:hypothetical protein
MKETESCFQMEKDIRLCRIDAVGWCEKLKRGSAQVWEADVVDLGGSYSRVAVTGNGR